MNGISVGECLFSSTCDGAWYHNSLLLPVRNMAVYYYYYYYYSPRQQALDLRCSPLQNLCVQKVTEQLSFAYLHHFIQKAFVIFKKFFVSQLLLV